MQSSFPLLETNLVNLDPELFVADRTDATRAALLLTFLLSCKCASNLTMTMVQLSLSPWIMPRDLAEAGL